MSDDVTPFRHRRPRGRARRPARPAAPAPAGPRRRPSTTGPRASRSATSRSCAAYWADGYDWRATEARLTRSRSSAPRSTGSASTSSTCARRTPTRCRWCITHGWPGSVVEFHKVIGPLTDPDRPRRRRGRRVPRRLPVAAGLRLQRQADRHRLGRRAASPTPWAQLMARLGYDRYGAQGGDWGAMVTTSIGRHDPDHVVGHPPQHAARAARPADVDDLTEQEQAALDVDRPLPRLGLGLLQAAVDPSADAGLRPRRLARPASARGSSRSSGRGPTATATPRTCSAATSCSTT